MLRALLRRWAAGSSMHAAATEVAVASGKSFSRVHDGSACAHDSAAGGAGGQAQQHAVPRPCNCHPPPSRPIAVRMRPAALSSPPGCAASSWYLHSSTSNALNKPDWPITTCAGMVVAQQRPAAAVACAVTPAPWATVRRCHFQRPLATGAPAQPAARHTGREPRGDTHFGARPLQWARVSHQPLHHLLRHSRSVCGGCWRPSARSRRIQAADQSRGFSGSFSGRLRARAAAAPVCHQGRVAGCDLPVRDCQLHHSAGKPFDVQQWHTAHRITLRPPNPACRRCVTRSS